MDSTRTTGNTALADTAGSSGKPGNADKDLMMLLSFGALSIPGAVARQDRRENRARQLEAVDSKLVTNG